MPPMSRQPAQADRTGSRRISWPALALPWAALALAVYVLWMGQALAWSNQTANYWFFLAPWWTATSVKYAVLLAFFAAVFRFGGDRVRRATPAVLALLLLGSQLLFFHAAWGVLRGTFPWGFDHSSFMYRIHEFGDVFPAAIGGYNPGWNAGTEHFVGVTSGSHAYGLLLWPLLKIWDPHVFYGPVLAFWFIAGFPWLGVASLRAAGVGRAGALCGGLLLCGASRSVFVWMWHFGTVGAMTSAMMVLPVVALGYRLAVLRRGSWGTALALGVAAWLMGLWSPGLFIGAGLGLGWLWNAREWSWRSNRWLFAAGALALALLLPWLWTTWFPCRGVLEHVGTAMERPDLTVMIPRGAQRLLRAVQEWHPVSVVLGLLGAAFLAPRPVRRWVLPALVMLAAISAWSREWKPLSQLERMAIPMGVVAIFPAAILCGRLLDGGEGGDSAPDSRAGAWWRALAQGIVLATVLMGFRVIRVHYANQGPAPLRTFSPEMREFVDWIRAEVPEDGRMGFAGRTVHNYGGGNIAYLPVLAGREMMADDYYGFPRGTIEFNYPPAYYRQNMKRYQFFEEAYGITHWAASAPDAQEILAAFPGIFEPVKEIPMLGRIIEIYRVRDPGRGTRFWEGSGRVDAQINRIEVFPDDPSAELVVIRYNWREGLVCRTPGASIEPVAIDANLRFIGIRPGGNASVELGYRPHWAPVQPNFDGHFHH